MAGNGSQVLGGEHSPGRLSCSLPGLSSSPFSHPGIASDVPGRLSSGSSLAARDRGDACQRSLRNRPRSGSRLLQPPLPGGEGVWRLETRVQGTHLIFVCSCYAAALSSFLFEAFYAPEEVARSPEGVFGGRSLSPICGPVGFRGVAPHRRPRAGNCPSSLYTADGSNIRHSPSLRYQDAQISRRLVDSS